MRDGRMEQIRLRLNPDRRRAVPLGPLVKLAEPRYE
jgi:hypothetical protein